MLFDQVSKTVVFLSAVQDTLKFPLCCMISCKYKTSVDLRDTLVIVARKVSKTMRLKV